MSPVVYSLLQLTSMEVELWQIVVVFMVMFSMAIFSGIAGGGGSLVTLPMLIALGLTPQQAVATSKFTSFGMVFGATATFKKKAFSNPRLVIFLVITAFLVSLIVPHIFNRLSSDVLQVIIGTIILLMVPVMLLRKHGLEARHTSKRRRTIGALLFPIVFLLQGVFSGGINILINVILISCFGISTLHANAIKRFAVLALNTSIVIVLVTTTDYTIYKLAIPGLIASFLGGYIGSHIALKKGENFARYALVGIMIISGVGLLVTA